MWETWGMPLTVVWRPPRHEAIKSCAIAMKTRTRNSSTLSFTKCRRVLSLAAAALSLFTMSGQCASPLYPSVVIGDGPLAYYRFNDSTNRANINANMAASARTGNATNLNTHIVNDGAVVGSRDAATYFDSTARAIVPWTAALNPNATNDFTIEGWFNPSSDGTFGAYAGPSPIMNRFSGAAINRQGWVYFQRSPDSSYSNPDGVGWNFRTYTGVGSDVGVTVTSQVPYRLGEWQYVVTVWDGAAQTATMYINGTNVASAGNSSSDTNAYVANTDTTGQSDAPNGPAGLSIGAYNNTDPGSDAFKGAVDEVAFYSKKLTPARIMAHYQNATNASRAITYDALVKSDGPVGYWRLDDLPADASDVAINEGTLQNTGMATNTADVRHPGTSPLASGASSSCAYHYRNGSSTTNLPTWLPANNPPPGNSFTLELWVRPTWDQSITAKRRSITVSSNRMARATAPDGSSSSAILIRVTTVNPGPQESVGPSACTPAPAAAGRTPPPACPTMWRVAALGLHLATANQPWPEPPMAAIRGRE